jgi:hypothetical protein
MAISRPNVSLTVIDESITIPTTETGSPTVGLFITKPGSTYSKDLAAFGTTAEKSAGYYLVTDLNDWYGRLQSYVQIHNSLGGASGLTFISAYLATEGATFWTKDWYGVNNFLQYGGQCYVGFTAVGIDTVGYEAVTPDVAFCGSTLANYALASYATNKFTKNEPVFTVFNITSEYFLNNGLTAFSGKMVGITAALTAQPSQFAMMVYGEKNQLNAGGDASTLVKTPLGPDIAGCFARTDRNSFPWISPAGVRRGQILNTVSLTETLSESQQDNLYNLKVNPVLNFAGEGTFLFGDVTFNYSTSASTFDAVNVARLVIYLRKVLGQLGRTILFEQNDSISRNRFLTSADAILRTIKAQSGVSDYKIVCDETNNPPSVVQARQFVADILIKAIPSINYVKITITNKNLSATL